MIRSRRLGRAAHLNSRPVGASDMTLGVKNWRATVMPAGSRQLKALHGIGRRLSENHEGYSRALARKRGCLAAPSSRQTETSPGEVVSEARSNGTMRAARGKVGRRRRSEGAKTQRGRNAAGASR